MFCDAPVKGLVVVILSPPDLLLMVTVRAFVGLCAGDSESVTLTLKDAVPLAVGVPEITPAVESDNPAGKLPAAKDHVSGDTPPVAVRIWL